MSLQAEPAMAPTSPARSIDSTLICRGRLWLAIMLWVFGAICFALVIATFFLGWFAVFSIGLSCLFASYVCLTFGYGEAVLRVELRPDGFSIRLPRYRGYYPFWPARRLSGRWQDVTELRRTWVTARMLVTPLTYIAHTIHTKTGGIMVFESLPLGKVENRRVPGRRLDVPHILDEFARRSPVPRTSHGPVNGGGTLRNLLLGTVPAELR